jgi:hypothetical protein
LILLGLLSGGAASVCAYLRHPKFGAFGGEDMSSFQDSPNYLDGRFQNLLPTPILSEDGKLVSALFSNLTGGDTPGKKSARPTGFRPCGYERIW